MLAIGPARERLAPGSAREACSARLGTCPAEPMTEIPMSMNIRWIASVMILTGLGGPVSADAITDWNEKAAALVTKHRMLPPQAERIIASVHVAMFDAVNSIEPRYRPYLAVMTPRNGASKEAAAAVAAG